MYDACHLYGSDHPRGAAGLPAYSIRQSCYCEEVLPILREAVGSIPTTDQSDLKLLVCRRFHIILHNCSFQVSYGHNTTELFDTC